MDEHRLDDGQWSRILRILDEALAAPEDERSAVIDHACGDDDELRRTVNRLLRSGESDALEQPAAEVTSDLIAESLPAHAD